MKEKYIEINLKRKALQELLEQVKLKSTSFSIVRYYNGYMSQEEYNDMQKKFMNKIVYEHEQRILDYQNNLNRYRDELNSLFHFIDEKEALDYFDELFNQELEVYENCQYCEFENQEPIVSDIPIEYLLKKEYTRMTPVSIGPVFEMFTFSMAAFDEVMSHMKKLFSPYKVFGGEFEDLCCYNGEKIIFKVCTHEDYAIVSEDIN
ncbi:hypothetical protein [Candidatus Stoquefichus sp. SB1]|uniref:hypothetical protein n=1 Tax=Candidatus Stoquefichus sp. SB1 TaxID=1658109 RepID=UPI00067F57B1|nr:hypothetical protein [Candidatus Stoquefichus sp. SB1]